MKIFLLFSLSLFYFSTQMNAQGADCTDATQILVSGDQSSQLGGAGSPAFPQHYYFFNPLTDGSVTLEISSPNDCGVTVEVADYPASQAITGTPGCVPTGTPNRITSNHVSGCIGSTVNSTTFATTGGRYYYLRVYRQNVGTGETYTLSVTFGGALPVLPISLLSQTATQRNSKTLIEWSTGAEKNNSHFMIERSLDGQQFEAIGTIEGMGTTNVETNYQFIDERPFTENYYRIIQYDLDGKEEIFPVMHLQLKPKSKNFKLYANGSELVLNYDAILAGNYQLQIVNTMGQIVNQQTIAIDSGENQQMLDIFSDLQNGLYFGRLQYQNEVVQTSFIVTK